MVKRAMAITLVAGALGATGAAIVWSGPATARQSGGATTPVPTTAVAPSSSVATTVSAPAATTTVVTLPDPAGESVDPARTLIPRIAAIPAVLTTNEDRLAAIDVALDDPGTAIAVESGPGTLCAIVPVEASLMVAGRWERNGEPVASSGETRRDPPGYGDCLPNDNGTPFPDGTYQYVAIGATGARSAAATVVVGAGTVDALLLNDGDAPVCMLHASPTQADFYEAFGTDSPLQPGEAMTIRVADVDQDVRVFGCPPDDVLRTFRFSPEPQTYVALFDSPGTTTTPPGTGATTPATTPATPTAPTSSAASTTTTA